VTLNPGSEQKQNCRATKLNKLLLIYSSEHRE